MSSRNGGNAKPSASTPVKWTLVEAVAETPEGRRSKQRRGRGANGSGSTGNWRQARGGGGGGGGGGQRNNQGGRGRGFGGGGGGGGSRNNQGRGRGYGGGSYFGGATFYPTQQQGFGAVNHNFEEQKAYMTNMAVRQIEFYFTVENLCRDIFMRSYMDEEGFIPIAFVANFPGVARFGVELEDIAAGILSSDKLQVDTENETMRMRDGWETWLLPNQATGKQGVPRYIKVGPPMDSQEATKTNEADSDETPEKSKNQGGVIAEEVPETHDAKVVVSPSKEGSDEEASKKGEGVKEPDVEGKLERPEERQVQKGSVKPEFEFTPNAPAWTPGGVASGMVKGKIVSIAIPPSDKVEDSSASSSSGAIPEGSGGGGATDVVAREPTGVPAAELNP